MLTRDQILDLLRALDAALAQEGVHGEVCLYGGSVMCLVYHSRPATRDVDAVFEPSDILRSAAARIASERDLPADWLNDAVKRFLVEHPRRPYLEFDHLRVLVPDAEYMLAMKALAARFDTSDRDDVLFLIRELKLTDADAVFKILEKFYPPEQIRPATRFFIEELLPPI